MSNTDKLPKYDFEDIYDLLCEGLPKKYTDGKTLHVNTLAEDMDMSAEGIYKILRSNKISPKRALEIIKLSRGKLTRYDFIEFVFNI